MGFILILQCVMLRNLQGIKEIANKEALPLKIIQLDVNDDLSAKKCNTRNNI